MICLVLSLTVCVTACFAWLALNDTVSSSGIGSSIATSDDISDISLKAYYLKGNTTDGYTTDGTLTLNDTQNMVQYGSLSSDRATAVLLEVSYLINSSSLKTFKLCGTVDGDKEITSAEKIGSTNNYRSSLSNVVSFWQVNKSGSVYKPISSTVASYVNNNGGTFAKKDKVTIFSGLAGNAAMQTSYILMDYNSELFGNVYSQVLQKGGNISSNLNFVGDVNITLSEEVEGENIKTAYSIAFYSGTTAQVAGDDNITSTWKFRVTYTDGSREIIDASADGLTLSGVNTANATTSASGKVSFTSGGKTVTTTVGYKVASSEKVTTNNLNLSYYSSLSDNTALSKSDLATDDNKFLTLIDGASSPMFRKSKTMQALDIKGDTFTVTFNGSGYITFTICSTGSNNTSTFALKDENGNYIAAETELNHISSGTEEGAYTVTSTTFAEITFRINSAGTYTICSPQDTNKRACRIGSIAMTDIVYEY
jgi:hypothetical protein